MTPPVLGRVKAIVEPALRSVVDTLDDQLKLPATYHLGWTDAEGAPVDLDSGKGVRSALAVLGAEAVGGQAADAVPGAVAVELIHNFSLIHDDIMDDDRTRRHRPTVWDVFGVGDAIIVGDALHALGFQLLLRDPANSRAVAAAARLALATSAMIAGQAQDVALDRRTYATLDECVAMEANKTGALLAQSTAIGGVLGGGGESSVHALESFGASLGIAFQAIDDILGIWGDPARTGKPVGNDLREQKKSMPIAIALEAGGAIADAVSGAFAGPMADDEVRELAAHLDAAGIRAEVEMMARRHLDEAIAALDTASLAPAARAELVELAHFVTERTT